MNLDMIPLISFVFVTTFTPGPNNISSASMGMRYGYRKTVAYLLGISSGFFVVMLACALLSNVPFVPASVCRALSSMDRGGLHRVARRRHSARQSRCRGIRTGRRGLCQGVLSPVGKSESGHLRVDPFFDIFGRRFRAGGKNGCGCGDFVAHRLCRHFHVDPVRRGHKKQTEKGFIQAGRKCRLGSCS